MFLVSICLASSISYAGYDWMADTGVFANWSFGSFLGGDCYNLDNLTQSVDKVRSEIEVNCNDPDADIKCIDDSSGTIQALHGTRVTTYPHPGYPSRYFMIDCINRNWTTEGGDVGGNPIRCGITTEGRYYTIRNLNDASPPYICDDVTIHIKNDTYNPYLTMNFTTENYVTSEIHETMNIFQQKDRIHIYLTDMGYTIDQNLVSSSEWTFYYDNVAQQQSNALSLNLGGHSPYDIETHTDNNLNEISCGAISSYQTADLYGMNIPLGTYWIYCHNLSGRTYYGFQYADLKFINVTNDNLDLFIGKYTGDLTGISYVFHQPPNPLPNMTVTIIWLTTTDQNGTIFWRNKPVGNWSSGWSSWTQKTDTVLKTQHNITIDNINILEYYQYQYYVKSGATTDNNTDLFYNFSVAGITPPFNITIPDKYINETIKPAPMIYIGAKNLERNTGIDAVLWKYFAFIFILILVSAIGMIFSGSPIVGVAIFITGIAVFSLMGGLPFYLFVIVTILFAFVLARIIMGVIV